MSPGFRADLIAVDVSGPNVAPSSDPYSSLVYACRGTDVRLTMVDGDVLVRDGTHRDVDAAALAAEPGTRRTGWPESASSRPADGACRDEPGRMAEFRQNAFIITRLALSADDC